MKPKENIILSIKLPRETVNNIDKYLKGGFSRRAYIADIIIKDTNNKIKK